MTSFVFHNNHQDLEDLIGDRIFLLLVVHLDDLDDKQHILLLDKSKLKQYDTEEICLEEILFRSVISHEQLFISSRPRDGMQQNQSSSPEEDSKLHKSRKLSHALKNK